MVSPRRRWEGRGGVRWVLAVNSLSGPRSGGGRGGGGLDRLDWMEVIGSLTAGGGQYGQLLLYVTFEPGKHLQAPPPLLLGKPKWAFIIFIVRLWTCMKTVKKLY